MVSRIQRAARAAGFGACRFAGALAALAALSVSGQPALPGGIGDFNGDGKADVLLRDADGGWQVHAMDGRARIAGGAVALPEEREWKLAGVGDLNGDGRDDALLRSDDGAWSYHPLNGASVGSGAGEAGLMSEPGWSVAGVGDFDGDGRDDVLLRHADGRWHYYRMDGRRHLVGSGSVESMKSNPDWQVAGIGDFNGNGRDDVLLRHAKNGRWHFYPLKGRRVIDSGKGHVGNMSRNLDWSVAGTGDFNGDGRHDVLLRHKDGRWQFYPMLGWRVIGGKGPVGLTRDPNWQIGGIGDFNGDGRDDVLLLHRDGRLHYQPMNGRARDAVGGGLADLSEDGRDAVMFQDVPLVVDGKPYLVGAPELEGDPGYFLTGPLHSRYLPLVRALRPEWEGEFLFRSLSLKDGFGIPLSWCDAEPVLSASLTLARDGVKTLPPPYSPLREDRRHRTKDGEEFVFPRLAASYVPEFIKTDLLFVDEDKFEYPNRIVAYREMFVDLFAQTELQALVAVDSRYEDLTFDAGMLLLGQLKARAVREAERLGGKARARAERFAGVSDTVGHVLAVLKEIKKAEERRTFVNRALEVVKAEARMVAMLEHIERSRDRLDPALVHAAQLAAATVAAGNESAVDAIREGIGNAGIPVAKLAYKGGKSAYAKARAVAVEVYDDAVAQVVAKGTKATKTARLIKNIGDRINKLGKAGKLGKVGKFAKVGGKVVSLKAVMVGDAIYDAFSVNESVSHFVLLWNATQSLHGILKDAEESPGGHRLSTEAFRLGSHLNNTLRLTTFRFVHFMMIGENDWLSPTDLLQRLAPSWRKLKRELESELEVLERQELANAAFFQHFGHWMSVAKRVYTPAPSGALCGEAAKKPDLVVVSPSVSSGTLDAGESFTLRATVRNVGDGASSRTTLRYYRSSNRAISTSDTRVGTDGISALSAGVSEGESISLAAPSGAGAYYYGACVDAVTGESDAGNNCSDGVRVDVSGSGGGGGGYDPGDAFRDPLSGGGEGPEMAVIPSGSFRMGCLNDDCFYDDSEKPVHEVTIGYEFALSKREVTFAQWDACVSDGGCGGYSPDDEGWGRGDRPVMNVNWNQARSYASWLSEKTGEAYRLPSESEWEYAARAGTRTKYHWGDEIGSNRANCDGCGSEWDDRQTAPVGSFPANAWGLHDMHGNVWEWVEDCRNSSYRDAPTDGSAWLSGQCSGRVSRGGSWNHLPWNLRAAIRHWHHTDTRYHFIGFRVARRVSRTLAP